MTYYFAACITILSALLGLIFSIRAAGEGKGNERANERTNALYMFARSLGLLCLAVAPLVIESLPLLALVTGIMLLVQAVDGIVGMYTKNILRTAGPFLMAGLHAICLGAIV